MAAVYDARHRRRLTACYTAWFAAKETMKANKAEKTANKAEKAEKAEKAKKAEKSEKAEKDEKAEKVNNVVIKEEVDDDFIESLCSMRVRELRQIAIARHIDIPKTIRKKKEIVRFLQDCMSTYPEENEEPEYKGVDDGGDDGADDVVDDGGDDVFDGIGDDVFDGIGDDVVDDAVDDGGDDVYTALDDLGII